jgi:hypothetical protein
MPQEEVEMFKNFETSLHKKEVRNSREKVGRLIADDFIEFGKSGGIFYKKDTLDGLEGEKADLEIEVTDFTARTLAPEVVLTTYKATMIDSDNATKVSTNRSSVWIKRNGRWQITFHQGTKSQP